MKLRKAYSFNDVMLVPQHSTLFSRADADLSTIVASVHLKIPIIAANMSSVCEAKMAKRMADLGGLGIIHRMTSIDRQQELVIEAMSPVHDSGWSQKVGFSIGIGDDWQKRMDSCIFHGAIACLDIAHADHDRVFELLKIYYERFADYPIIIGQVSTPLAVRRLLTAVPEKYFRTTAFKASIGGGSLCTTRIKTGFGIPTLQAIMDIAPVLSEYPGVTLVADGGIKNSGDIVKALAAGADAVMLGNLLAGTSEAPGEIILGMSETNYQPKFKRYRGSASFSDKRMRGEETKHIEGEDTLVPYKGPVEGVINDLLDGIRSGFSYGGAKNIQELQAYAEFVSITQLGFEESLAHGK